MLFSMVSHKINRLFIIYFNDKIINNYKILVGEIRYSDHKTKKKGVIGIFLSGFTTVEKNSKIYTNFIFTVHHIHIHIHNETMYCTIIN